MFCSKMYFNICIPETVDFSFLSVVITTFSDWFLACPCAKQKTLENKRKIKSMFFIMKAFYLTNQLSIRLYDTKFACKDYQKYLENSAKIRATCYLRKKKNQKATVRDANIEVHP